MHRPSGQSLPRSRFTRSSPRSALAILLWACSATGAAAAVDIQGQVVDVNGNPLPQVQVIFDREEPAQGASVVTVFSDAEGRFVFPGAYSDAGDLAARISVRALGYAQRERIVPADANSTSLELTFVMSSVRNLVDVAPASAWLARIGDRQQQSQFVMDCIDCHQVPASEVRNYAALIADQHAPDPANARAESWNAVVKYMNYLSAWEFSRGRRGDGEEIDADAVYSVANAGAIVPLLASTFDDRLDYIEDFDWGAPLIATAATTIWEYEVPQPNAIREAIMTGTPAKLWVADVAANRLVSIDVASGAQQAHEVPSEVLMSPHSMHRG